MKITFKNGNVDLDKARRSLNSRSDDIKEFIKGIQSDNDETREEAYQSYSEYALAFDYVAPEAFEDQHEGYLRYQISYGGPSEEVRFYYSPGGKKPYRIEFVFLDWGVGVGFDVTGQEWAQWLAEDFYETGSVQAAIEKATED